METTDTGEALNGTQSIQPTTQLSPTGHVLRRIVESHLANERRIIRPNAHVQVHPGHISNDNKAILTVPLVLMALSIIFVGLRIWTRGRLVRFLGWDDYWILGALATNIASTMLAVAGTFKGEGSHIADVEDEDLTYILKILYAETLLQPLTLNFIKFSLLSFYLRLPGQFRFLRLTKITYAFVVAMMLAFVLTLALACIPVSRQWDIYETKGGCIDRAMFWHVILALNVATNIWILALPMKLILALKVDRRQKIMVFCIFGVGAVATIASILALIELPLAIGDPDKTWGSWRLAVYTAVQNNLGIIAASAAALKPLLGKTVKKVKSSVGSRLSTTLWTAPSSATNSSAPGVSSNKSASKISNAADKSTSSRRSSKKLSSAGDGGSRNSFHLSDAVRRVISPRSSVTGPSMASSNRTGNASYHTALASRSHRDSAILDTIGILPIQPAFPAASTLGSFRTAKHASVSFRGNDADASGSIQHIREWDLDKNDYCMDPSMEHELPLKPKTSHKRDSMDEISSWFSARGSPRGSRRLSQSEIFALPPPSPIDSSSNAARRRSSNLEVCEEDTAGEADDQVMSHEEWKNAGGYV